MTIKYKVGEVVDWFINSDFPYYDELNNREWSITFDGDYKENYCTLKVFNKRSKRGYICITPLEHIRKIQKYILVNKDYYC